MSAVAQRAFARPAVTRSQSVGRRPADSGTRIRPCEPATDGGSDTEEIKAAGVPVFSLNQDASRYFDLHHSADDTLDKVDPLQLNQNVAAWASLLWLMAN